MATCSGCRFSRKLDGSVRWTAPAEPIYQCRRFPPGYRNGDQVWPLLRARDWCGEHEPRNKPTRKVTA